MPKVSINGVNLYYEEHGKGPPLLLLHGLTSSGLMYDNEIEVFKERYRVITLDSRGHGKSEKPEHYTLHDHVQDVISFLDHLEIEKANILGMSMGSYIAQGVAARIPDRIEKLILVVPKAHGKTSSMARLSSRHEDEIAGLDYTEKMNYLARYIFHKIEDVQQSMALLYEKQPILTPEQEIAANQALEDFDFRPHLKKVTAKTLVISGTYDGLNPPEDGQEVAKHIPDAVFIAFDQSGHAPNLEEPDKFRKEVLSFLSS